MASDEIDQLNAQITSLQQSQKEKDLQIRQVTTERDELQNTMQEMATLFEEMTKKAAEKDAKCKIQMQEIETLQKRVTIVEQELQEEEAANNALSDTIETLERKRSASLRRQPSAEDLNDLMTKIQKLEQLLKTSQEKVDENEKLHRDINELTQLFEELQAKIKMRDETIQDYEAKLEELQNEYREELQGNEHLKTSYTALLKRGQSVDTDGDVTELQDKLQAQHKMIRQISTENEQVVDSITRDKDNAHELLEQTYEIINDELVRRLKQHKLSLFIGNESDVANRTSKQNFWKAKRVGSPDTLREHLKKIRESLVAQNVKIQELMQTQSAGKSSEAQQQSLSDNDSKEHSRNDDEKHREFYDEDQESDIDVDRVLNGAPPHDANQNGFRSLFSFFKDF